MRTHLSLATTVQLLLALILPALVLPALAQDPPGERRGRDRTARTRTDDVPRRDAESPENRRARPAEPAGNLRASYERLVQRIPEQLELDAAQRRSYDRLAEEFLASLRKADEQRGERMRLQREYRQALQAGDQEQAGALRNELRSLGDARQLARDFFEDVEELLRPEQAEKFAELRRESRARGRAGPDDLADYRALLETLPAELRLDEQQLRRYRPLAAEFSEALDRQQAGWERLRELQGEIRAAVEANDEERLATLRAEAEAVRPDAPAAAGEFFDRLEPILRDDQRGLLAEIRLRHGDHNAAPPAQRSLQSLQRAVRRLRLTEAQREPVRAALADALRAMRRVAPDDAATRAKLYDEAHAIIRDQLDAAQRQQLEQELARASARPGGQREAPDRARPERNRTERRRGT